MPNVQIDMAEGRTLEQKREAAQKITQVISDVFKCPPDAVVITMRELPRTNFAKAGVLLSDK
ncbi:MAG: tautomerase family protein [Negativicutes bacterium]|nr:tautomerase family protein [Negativicutes bacterium]